MERSFCRDTKLRAAGGEVAASLLLAPDDFRIRLSNTIAPTAFAPLMGKKERDVMKLFTSAIPPTCSSTCAAPSRTSPRSRAPAFSGSVGPRCEGLDPRLGTIED